MKCVVDNMAQGKTRAILDGGFRAKSEIVSQQIICAETDAVTYRVCEPCPYP